MTKARYIFISMVILMGLLASTGCSISSKQVSSPPPTEISSENIPSEPIEPNWEPVYVETEAGLELPHGSNFEVVQKVAPTVVSIFTETMTYDLFLQPYPQQGAGTGVIIDPKGYIVTNNHVVEGADKIEVILRDGRIFEAVDVVRDPPGDLAVIKIEAEDLPTAHFLENSLEQLRVGDEVIAIGNALALPGGPTVTKGIISYLGRTIQVQTSYRTITLHDLIQTDAAINPGNSGGPLVNMAGQVVGISTAIAQAENIGFAISNDTLLPLIRELVAKGHVAHPWLGVEMTDLTRTIKSRYRLEVDTGVFITRVVKGSPAQQARLEAGDVIIGSAGQEVTTALELQQIIQSCQVGERVEIVFYRGKEKRATWATLAQMP